MRSYVAIQYSQMPFKLWTLMIVSHETKTTEGIIYTCVAHIYNIESLYRTEEVDGTIPKYQPLQQQTIPFACYVLED